jgi:hypothetical protein
MWLGASDNRRTTLRGITAGALAIALGRVEREDAAAGKTKNKDKKKPIGAHCKTAKECKGSLKCRKTPGQDPGDDAYRKRCCKEVGASCVDHWDCCGLLICNLGICVID